MWADKTDKKKVKEALEYLKPRQRFYVLTISQVDGEKYMFVGLFHESSDKGQEIEKKLSRIEGLEVTRHSCLIDQPFFEVSYKNQYYNDIAEFYKEELAVEE